MPLPIIPMVPFPNVPNAPGVPQLARSLTAPVTPTPSLGRNAASATLWQSTQTKPTWGIYNSAGVAVIVPDSFMDFRNRNSSDLTSAYVQKSAFASYNKVRKPFDTVLRMRKGGTLQNRTDFLNQIDAIANDTNLYTILTPEKSYQNCNISDYEVTRRGVNGAYLLADVDIFFKEIVEVSAQYSSTSTNTQNAKSASAIPQVNQGPVQPQPVNFLAAQQASAAVTRALNPTAF